MSTQKQTKAKKPFPTLEEFDGDIDGYVELMLGGKSKEYEEATTGAVLEFFSEDWQEACEAVLNGDEKLLEELLNSLNDWLSADCKPTAHTSAKSLFEADPLCFGAVLNTARKIAEECTFADVIFQDCVELEAEEDDSGPLVTPPDFAKISQAKTDKEKISGMSKCLEYVQDVHHTFNEALLSTEITGVIDENAGALHDVIEACFQLGIATQSLNDVLPEKPAPKPRKKKAEQSDDTEPAPKRAPIKRKTPPATEPAKPKSAPPAKKARA